jgi:DNA polymerase-3 subunit gamma/tau
MTGSSMNVVEIDAASNNSVDNIREIRDEVKYSPTEGRYRVYIIDEVHMLSTGAYNALLKTLEEPPSYVIFILATTEVHKLPVTVLSRCQRYDFKRIAADRIFGQLQKLTGAENIPAEEKALKYIARAADGAMRDALSILEECVSYYYGQPLTYENVLEVVGAVDTSVFTALLQNILDCDVTAAMRLIGELVYSGRDITQTVGDFVWFLRNLLLIQTSEVTEDELGMSAENFDRHKQVAMKLGMEDLMRYIRAFSDLQNSMRYATDKRTLLELAVIRAMKPETERDFSGLMSRVRALEQTVQELAAGGVVKAERIPTAAVPEAEPSEPVKEVCLSPAVYEDLEQLLKHWNEITRSCGGAVKGFLEGTKPTYREGIGFVVPFDSDFQMSQIARPERLELLETAAAKILNKEIHFKLMPLAQLDPNVRLVKSDTDMPHQGVGVPIGEE